MPKHSIDINECIECGFCESICPKSAISERSDFAYTIDDRCINCSLCLKNCPVKAITAPPKPMKEKSAA